MKPGIDSLQLLCGAAKERRLMPFIGAGFSKNVDRSMPVWDDVIDIAAGLLDYTPSVIRAQGDSYQIADLLAARGRLERFYQIVADTLDSDRYQVSASRPHALLPYIDAGAIFTTNWDSWIEKAFLAQGVPYRKIRSVADLRGARVTGGTTTDQEYAPAERARLRNNPQTDIYKLHGDFSREKSLVFRESDYFERMKFEDPLDIRLRAEILEKSVVFIGYSNRDMDVRLIWHRLSKSLEGVERGRRPTSFFVTYGDFPLQRELFEQKNIEIVSLDPRDKSGSLAALFEQIIDAQRN